MQRLEGLFMRLNSHIDAGELDEARDVSRLVQEEVENEYVLFVFDDTRPDA